MKYYCYQKTKNKKNSVNKSNNNIIMPTVNIY